MNSNYKNILNKIINANNDSKLVIFVGSGISRNSNIPGWGYLVKKMGESLEINVDDLSSDDYLKIPQMLFDKSPDEYKKVLNEVLNNDYETNQLDDLIIKLQPDHIITTNYDTLIEQSINNVGSEKIIK
ncbi:SIR2 family protein [Apilactobacillus micheneri]|uniref:hypothetical protein n=1 Tax=Apilactobacillus micheneri TaxID=1899430 RepID=UPI000D03AE24|nr:hypothetical protein [Apilactobacillus micheneri]